MNRIGDANNKDSSLPELLVDQVLKAPKKRFTMKKKNVKAKLMETISPEITQKFIASVKPEEMVDMVTKLRDVMTAEPKETKSKTKKLSGSSELKRCLKRSKLDDSER